MAAKSRKEQIEEMLAEDPHDPFLRYGLAMEHVSAGDDRTAIGCFADLLSHAPDYIPAYLQMGQAWVRLGQDDEARKVLSQGIAAARRTGDGHAEGEMQGLLDSL